MKEAKDIANKAYVVFALLSLICISIMAKIFMIQLVEGKTWKIKAENTLYFVREIQPSRGQILADDGSLLATSVPIFTLYWDAQADGIDKAIFQQELDSMALRFSQVMGDKSKAEYKAIFLSAVKAGNRYKKITVDIDYSQKQEIEGFPFIRRGRYKSGFIFERNESRLKPFGDLAARTIGLDREEHRVGLEGAYHHILAGSPGKRLEQKIPGGFTKPVNDDYIVEPELGQDIVTSIDVHLQDVATNSLLSKLEEHGATWGTVILMEVETGFIKAMANLQYDEKTGQYSEVLNHAVGTRVEPGSTFKLPALMAAIDDGLANLEDTVDTYRGAYSFHKKPMHDSNEDEGGNGLINVLESFSLSSNIGTAKTIKKAYGKNPQQFLDKLVEMGLHDSLGIDIVGEQPPMLRKKVGEPGWSLVSPTQMAIGYEILQTPLQTLAFYNAVANDGVMVRPRLVTEFRRNGKTTKKFKPEVIREKICSDETLAIARQMLEAVVDSGTGKKVFTGCPYKVAGKTGTARVTAGNKYVANRYRASFCGYFPADEPRYSCIIVVSEPKSGIYYASSIAAPVFRNLADKIYSTEFDIQSINELPLALEKKLPVSKDGSRLELLTVYEKLGIQSTVNTEDDWVRVSTSEDSVSVNKLILGANLVPDVKGMGLQDALYLLETSGLKVKTVGCGTVKRQSLTAGSRAIRGQQITIELS
jgi:cell division protein FtsI (penicillin-binding protein 3)